MQPQAKDGWRHQELEEAGWIPPESSRVSAALQHLDLAFLASRCERMNFRCHLSVVLCYGSLGTKMPPNLTPGRSTWLALLPDPGPIRAIGMSVVTPHWPHDHVSEGNGG